MDCVLSRRPMSPRLVVRRQHSIFSLATVADFLNVVCYSADSSDITNLAFFIVILIVIPALVIRALRSSPP